jgi:plasmid replication initiation protein
MDTENNNKLEIRQSNIITNSRYEMSACELDLVFLLLSQLKKTDDNNQKYTLYVKEIESITGREWQYQQLRESTMKLVTRGYEFTNQNGNLMQITLFSSCEYLKGKGSIEIEISPKMRPYLFDLKEKFTSFKLMASLNMNSKFSKRIYMLCSQFKDLGKLKMSIEELKFKLHLKDPKGKEKEQFKQIGQLKKDVLNRSVKEINEYSDILIQYELFKKGRSFVDIVFTIIPKDTKHVNLIKFDENVEIQKITQILQNFNITRNDLVTKICNDENLHKIVYKWHYDYKLGNFSNVQNPAGHLLKTLGLVK